MQILLKEVAHQTNSLSEDGTKLLSPSETSIECE
jgi:hypothetical protein